MRMKGANPQMLHKEAFIRSASLWKASAEYAAELVNSTHTYIFI